MELTSGSGRHDAYLAEDVVDIVEAGQSLGDVVS
jgi:hypothetical protein